MVQKMKLEDRVVCVVGLGYVGLPLALAFGRTKLKTYGFDVNRERIDELKKGLDSSGELTVDQVKDSKLIYTSADTDIAKSDFVIVAVPTPVNQANQPDMSLVEKASETVGHRLKKGSIVVYESTVYPGATEEICVPILENESGLKCGKDFKIGYSPERINPGDKEHTLESIVKVVSGMDRESTAIVADVYATVCQAGVHVAPNIKTAEAAKVIENTQRDLNIALMNELSLIFHRLRINTSDVLAAAGTKWNFLKFTPGLVGGHCIGVDPYYLVYKAEEVGYHPQVIAAGRRVNDYMPEFVASEVIKTLVCQGKRIDGATVVVAGLTFKENVKDIRNSKISGTIKILKEYGVNVVGLDPLLDKQEVEREFGIKLIARLPADCDAIIIAAPHREFRKLLAVLSKNTTTIVYDIKSAYPELKSKKQIVYLSL